MQGFELWSSQWSSKCSGLLSHLSSPSCLESYLLHLLSYSLRAQWLPYKIRSCYLFASKKKKERETALLSILALSLSSITASPTLPSSPEYPWLIFSTRGPTSCVYMPLFICFLSVPGLFLSLPPLHAIRFQGAVKCDFLHEVLTDFQQKMPYQSLPLVVRAFCLFSDIPVSTLPYIVLSYMMCSSFLLTTEWRGKRFICSHLFTESLIYNRGSQKWAS